MSQLKLFSSLVLKVEITPMILLLDSEFYWILEILSWYPEPSLSQRLISYVPSQEVVRK